MGCFVSKDSGNNLASGRRIDALKEKLLPSHRVVVVELKGANELKSVRAKLFRANGPFFEISIRPEQELTGDQTYRSSHRPPTTEPRWEPPEKFEFVVTDLTDAKIIIGAWNFNSTRSPDEIGINILELKDVTETKTEKKLKIYSSDTGDFVGLVDLNVYSMDARKAASIVAQIVYEYQRWKPVQGWGSTPAPGHFMATDPGRWSNDDQSSFGDSIDSVLKKVGAKIEILKPWGAVGNEHDVDGWTYATNFNYLDWWPEQGSGMFVRRRQWRREITIISDDNPEVSPLQKTDYVPPSLSNQVIDDAGMPQHNEDGDRIVEAAHAE
jgi:hypothetical protein